MKINTSPVKGTQDFLPAEMEIRQDTINKILDTFEAHGFLHVKTPILENLQILTTGDSGENQKLMFKTIKRGEKLNLSKPNLTEADIVEEGLRYDLTVPLARLYAGNREKLTTPFKAIQIDDSFRAEKPQRGRWRQFTQCDIDIWGDDTIFAEVEILLAALDAYSKIGITDITFKINDRRALAALISHVGFVDTDINNVCTSLDKLDKIGAEAVAAEIAAKYKAKYANISKMSSKIVEIVQSLIGKTPKDLAKYGVDGQIIADLCGLIDTLKKLTNANIVFDITVVRGQGYYTGMVFECYTNSGNFSRAIGGGGRYNKMLEKFLGVNVPAVGYSIGLDTVVMLLKESGKLPKSNKYALIYPHGAKLEDVFATKQKLVASGKQISVFADPKNFRNFCEKLKSNNFLGIIKLSDPSKIIQL